MNFEALDLPGAFLIQPQPHVDERGFFVRTWCSEEFAEAGLPTKIVQTNLSQTVLSGTIRGLHYQRPPSREGKVVSTSARIHPRFSGTSGWSSPLSTGLRSTFRPDSRMDSRPSRLVRRSGIK